MSDDEKKESSLGKRMQFTAFDYAYAVGAAILREEFNKAGFQKLKNGERWEQIKKGMHFCIRQKKEFEKFRNGDFTLYGETFNYNELPRIAMEDVWFETSEN